MKKESGVNFFGSTANLILNWLIGTLLAKIKKSSKRDIYLHPGPFTEE